MYFSTSYKVNTFIADMNVREKDNCDTHNTYLIHIRLNELITKQEFEFCYNICFAQRNPHTYPTIRSCLQQIAIGTQVRIKQNENNEDQEVIICWKIDKNQVEFKRFKSTVLSVYEKGKDYEYDKLIKSKTFSLLGSSHIRILSVPEIRYLENQLLKFLDKYVPRKVVKLIN